MSLSIRDRSSLFLLGRRQSASDSEGDYILRACGGGRHAVETSPGLLGLNVRSRRSPSFPFAAALSRAVLSDGSAFFDELQGLASLITIALAALTAQRHLGRKLRIWSVDCGTGQPTYSLAIALAELCSGLDDWRIEIVASDTNAAALERAERGIYTSSEVQRGLPSEFLVRHFEELPAQRGWRFNSRLHEPITWLHLNGVSSCAAVGLADVVFCHRKRGGASPGVTRRWPLGRLMAQLATNGFLILQSPDSAGERAPELECVLSDGRDLAVYRHAREASRLIA